MKYLRDLGSNDSIFFCRAMNTALTNRQFCQFCPLRGTDEQGRAICNCISDSFDGTFPDYEGSTPLRLKAYRFAAKAHRGQKRKSTNLPYFVHLLEAAAIASSLTDQEEVIAAAILHDIIEDTSYEYEDVADEFGKEIADFVAYESENKMRERPSEETWYERKAESIGKLVSASYNEKLLVLSDKLSNIRALRRDVEAQGDAAFMKFNQKDKNAHGWYYKEIAARLGEFSTTEAYQELRAHIDAIFG